MGYLLGIDLGTSAIKVSLLDPDTGSCVASSTAPRTGEIPRTAPAPATCEQDPEDWWKYTCEAIRALPADMRAKVDAVGIAYQMHGLVLIDESGKPVRPAIIWADGRAGTQGDALATELGTSAECLLNRPGNFTMAKLRWVRDNEPEVLRRSWKALLPGDFIAHRLTGNASTTSTGLSEMIAWDFKTSKPFDEIWQGESNLRPETVPILGQQGHLSDAGASAVGLPNGTPLTYRAGDQPNNALSLNVLEPGEVAATAGTSGVMYAVVAKPIRDPNERVNVFLHVNSRADAPRFGALLCVNGAGSFYSWIRKSLGLSYPALDGAAESSAPGAEGLMALPYGNGPERSLGLKTPGAGFYGVDVNRHGQAHLARAGMESVVFALKYGAMAFAEMGQPISRVRAGKANMFLSPLFCQIFADTLGVELELLDTDGALGAARGAGVGSGAFSGFAEAMEGLGALGTFQPKPGPYQDLYVKWLERLKSELEVTR